jgi:hypothetical protein
MQLFLTGRKIIDFTIYSLSRQQNSSGNPVVLVRGNATCPAVKEPGIGGLETA